MTNPIQALADKFEQGKAVGECVTTLQLLTAAIEAYKPSDVYSIEIQLAIDKIAEMLMNDFSGVSIAPIKPTVIFFENVDDPKKKEEFQLIGPTPSYEYDATNKSQKIYMATDKGHLEEGPIPGLQSDYQPPILHGKRKRPTGVLTRNQLTYVEVLRKNAIKEKFPSKLARQLEMGRLGKICEVAGYIVELTKIKTRRAYGRIEEAFRCYINNATLDWNNSRALSDVAVIDRLIQFINFKNL